MKGKNIVIFASGEGTNAQSIIDHFRGSPAANICMIVSSKADARVVDRAKNENIPVMVLNKNEFYSTDKVVEQLKALNTDLIVLAGFLWMVPLNLVRAFPDRIINIHPALLPKFGGKGMYGMNVHKAVIAAGEKESGISIHYVNEHYDEGKIIGQYSCQITEGESPESLSDKVRQLELKYFPQVIGKLIQ